MSVYPMSRRAVLRAACAAGLALALSPLAAFATEADTVADAKRIVSIGGSVTEIVFALGEEGRLVARDSTGFYPPQAMELPDVGYMRQLSPEGVLSVDPDAILALEGSGPPEAVEVLKKASIPFVLIPEGFDAEGVLTKTRAVGHALGVEDKAERLAAKVEADLESARQAVSKVTEKRRVLFILSMQGGKVLASGAGTAASGIMDLAGADNVIDDFEGYKQLTDEAVIEARPEFILMMTRGGDPGMPDAELLAHPAIAATPAAANKAIVKMDGGFLLGFGPRTAEAARDLAHRLYGDQVSN